MNMNTVLLILWCVVAALALLAAVAVLVWAVRSKQFSDQDRARYLALDGGKEAASKPKSSPPGGSAARMNGNDGNVPA